MNFKKNNKNKKSQSMSTDLIVVIALLLFGVLFVVFNQINTQEERNFSQIEEQNKIISDSIYNSLLSRSVIDDNKVSLEGLKQISEDEIRQELGINKDFAIAFEKDGKLIYIDSEDNVSCVGSNKIKINNQNCGFKND